MEAVIEGLLFIAGDEGLSFEKMKEITELSDGVLEQNLELLKEEYTKKNRGITLEILGTKIKLVTKKEHKLYYEKYFSWENDSSLTTAALETLAIVAYNTPVTRGKVDEIRGVSSSHIIRKLLSKGLVEVKGKSDLPGRPNLYGVTECFLDYFGLSKLEDLPTIEIKEEETAEKDLYTAKYSEK